MRNKSSLYYKREGKGVPLVLLAGFAESASIWDNIVPELSESCEVITVDLPGFGNSKHLASPSSLIPVTKQIHQLIQSLDIKEYIIAGHSLGGYISLELASRYPESILGIGLIHSTAFADDDEKIANRKKIIDFVSKRGAEVFINSFVPQLFADKRSPNITAVIKLSESTPDQSLINYTKAMMDRKNHINTLRKWNKPLLMIAGEFDPLVSLEMSRKHLQFIPKTSFVELKGVGHMGMYEAPNEIKKLISALVCTISK